MSWLCKGTVPRILKVDFSFARFLLTEDAELNQTWPVLSSISVHHTGLFGLITFAVALCSDAISAFEHPYTLGKVSARNTSEDYRFLSAHRRRVWSTLRTIAVCI